MNEKKQRFWEIDSLRGIAVIMMIIYHVLFDLNFLHIVSVPLHTIWLRIFLYPIGTLFLLLVGISLVLSYNSYKNQHTRIPPFYKYFKRGIFLLSLALFITGLTWIYPHEGFIVFGVIHCISISIILSYYFISKPFSAFIVGIGSVLLGMYFLTLSVSNPYLFWLGLTTNSFYTLDYFPLFPWFGIVLIGIFIGQTMYPTLLVTHSKKQEIPPFLKPISYLGKHSLLIYLLHQPILFGILFLLM